MVSSRREWLMRAANGFGSVALYAMLSQQARCESVASKGATQLTFPQRAKSIIFLYMDGGPSQVDTFDPKPMLTSTMAKTRVSSLKSHLRSSTTMERIEESLGIQGTWRKRH